VKTQYRNTIAAIASVGICLILAQAQACDLTNFYTHPYLPNMEMSYPKCAIDDYEHAAFRCKDENARVCTYEDFYSIYIVTPWDPYFNVKNTWIGNMVGDDAVLCGNKDITEDGDVDIYNFEGVCNKHDPQGYFCCRDI
jgi:hypothetical protein